MSSPTVICITPVKNEAWILNRFLRCASQWADHIILADQGSTDGSVEIARRYPKVTVLRNDSSEYSENTRQNLLLSEARRVPGKRIILSLDADEVLSANWQNSPEWLAMQTAPEGTVIRFPKAELHPDGKTYWCIEGSDLVHGFIDDGSPHHGSRIHGPRLPMPEPIRWFRPQDLWLLHYRATDPLRCQSKMRWYQCWERVTAPKKRAITLHRQYNQDATVPESRSCVDSKWHANYEAAGIDMRSVQCEQHNWWDGEVIKLFADHGLETFRRLDVWNGHPGNNAYAAGTSWWQGMPDVVTSDGRTLSVSTKWPSDPRNRWEKQIHHWLRQTAPQQYDHSVRSMQRVLIPFGW